jgi:WD40 repeat protein
MSNFEHSYALVIGINNYKNGISPLKTAVSDATEIARILETQHDYNVTLLLDEAATIGQLRQVLETELPNQIQVGDRFLFYFAGHGIALNGEDGPEGYLVPQGARLGNVSTYFPMSEVNKALLQLPCRHFLGILDCCFAGAFQWSSTRKAIPSELVTLHKERYDRFIQDPAWQVVTSAAYDQSAWDAFDLKDDRGEIGIHSPFACALIEGLEGKADAFPATESGKPAGDGVITASELYLYLRDRVEIATQTRAIRQTPGIHCLKKHDKGEYIFLTPGHALNLPPAPPLDVSKNPYRGLLPFEEKHSNLFFGRNALTQKLYEFVTSHSLTVVLGASGSGKSSLVKAGVIHKIRQGQDGNTWFILPPFRPGESPFKALNNTLGAVNLPAIAIPSEATFSGLLPPAERLANWFKEHPQSHLLLVVDQFEELITLCRNDQEREQFLEGLAGAIATHPNQLHLVLILRSDFKPQFHNTALEKDWQTAQFVVPAMTRGELREAIEKPVEARVMYFQPHDLVEQLIDEVANMPGELPLLSFGLSELYLKYLKRQEDAKNQGETIDRAITLADYEELGGVVRSLTQRADREYETLVKQDPAYEQTIRNVMLRMVAVEGELARRRVPMSELEYPEPENTRIKTVIQRFSDARLLTNGIDSEGQPYVEPAHDALVRGWQKLLEWKKNEQENLNLQRKLTPAAEAWKNRQGSLWNTDPRLSLLKQILNSNYNWLNKTESEFIRNSIDRKRRNSLILGSSITGVFVGLLGFSGYIYTQGRDALISADARTSGVLYNLNKELDALVLAVEAGTALKQSLWTEPNTRIYTLATLQQAVYGVRERNRLEGVSDTIWNVNFSSDSGTIVAGSFDGKVIIWDVKNNRLKTIQGHSKYVSSVAFSPDGQMIASVGADQTVKFWRNDGTLLKTLQQNSEPVGIAFSPDGGLIASSTRDGTIELWNRQGSLLKSWKWNGGLNRGQGNTLSFSADGRLIAATTNNNLVALWNIDGKLITTFKGHKGAVTSLSFSSDGKLLASSSQDKTVKLWTLNGKLLKTLTGHTQSVNSVRFHPSKQSIVSASSDRTIKLWNFNGTELDTLKGHESEVYDVSFSPDGNLIASSSNDKTLRIWSLNAIPVETIQGNVVNFDRTGQILTVDGTWSSPDRAVKLWNRDGKLLNTLPIPSQPVGVSHDGKVIAVVSQPGTIKIMNWKGQQLKTRDGFDPNLGCITFSPDGQTIAVTSNSSKTVRLWDIRSENIKVIDKINDFSCCTSFSPDNQIIAANSWENKSVNILELNTGKITLLKGHQDVVDSVSFSPDGQTIATASRDNTIKLWRLDGTLLKTFKGHKGWVNSISFSPDGKILVSSSKDLTIKLWDINGRELTTLQVNVEVLNASFSPDGKTIASVTNKGKVTLWNFNLDDLLLKGCFLLQNYLKNPHNNLSKREHQLCNNLANF